ncbi:MAG: PhoD-like phosphatase N-terminal domain-containing protein [Bacteroidota bacterium]
MRTPILFLSILLGLSFTTSAQLTNHARKGDLGKSFDPTLEPFYHGVASGDPTEDGVIIWTRITPENESSFMVDYEVATDTGFVNIVQSGSSFTDANSDFTIKILLSGLSAGTTYYYRFSFDL